MVVGHYLPPAWANSHFANSTADVARRCSGGAAGRRAQWRRGAVQAQGMASSSLPPLLRQAVLTALVERFDRSWSWCGSPVLRGSPVWGSDLLPLLLTCRGAQEDEELLRLLLPAALNGRGVFGRTLLMAAARSDDRQLVQRLLDARPIIMGPHHQMGLAPEKAEAKRYSLECCSLLSRSSESRKSESGVNNSLHLGFCYGSALYFAASEGLTDMVHLLTSSRGMRPANLFRGEERPWAEWWMTESPAGYFAPLSKHPALLAELVRSSVDNSRRAAAVLGLEAVLAETLPAADDAELSELLHLAAIGACRQRETVLLLAQDARATAKAKLAAARKLRDAELVRAWSELDGVAPDDLLCAACAVGDQRLVRRAIRLGADLDSDGEIDDDPGKEGIHMAFESAISGKHLDLVRWLCKYPGVHHRFSLLAAIKIGDLALVQSITRQHGEDIVHEVWIRGISTLHWATSHYDFQFRELESALSVAAEHGHMEIVKWLCDTMGVDVEGAMHRALGVTCMGPCGLDPARNVEVARFLLERGAKTSFCSAEQPDREVGHEACYCDLINVAAQHGQHLVLLELLLRDYLETTDSSKADALNSALKEAVEEQQETHPCSYREAGRVKCAHLLLAFGADPRAPTIDPLERGQRREEALLDPQTLSACESWRNRSALQEACTDALRGALFDRAAVEAVKCSLVAGARGQAHPR